MIRHRQQDTNKMEPTEYILTHIHGGMRAYVHIHAYSYINWYTWILKNRIRRFF